MYIFQSEQVIKLRLWLNNLADLNPLDYHVYVAILGRYRPDTPKPINIAKLKIALLLIWNDLPHEFVDYFESKDFDRVVLQLADILNTQFKYQEGSWQLIRNVWCVSVDEK